MAGNAQQDRSDDLRLRNRRLLMAALGLLALLAVPLARHNPLVVEAQALTTKITVSAVALYASLRLINSVLSTAMETEVSGGAVLVSGTVQPLKVLEPVDDTVERMASAVFVVAMGAGLVSLALAPVSALGLGLLGVALLVMALVPHALSGRVSAMVRQARSIGLVIGLAAPFGILIGFAGGDHLTRATIAEANATLASITRTLEDSPSSASSTSGADATERSGVLGALQDQVFGTSPSIAASATDIVTSTARYLEIAGQVLTRADDLFVSLLRLVVAYIFQLMVLPLIIFVVLWRLLQAAVAGDG